MNFDVFPNNSRLGYHTKSNNPFPRINKTCFSFICEWPWSNIYKHLLPTGSEERRVLGVGRIPVAILPSVCKLLHYNCIHMNIVG